MLRRVLLFCGLAVFIGLRSASPTTVLPLDFDELIAKAELIFVGQVVESRSMYDGGREPRIVTVVTFDVVRVLKGQAGLRTELTFLGGTIGRQRLDVAGMPRFSVGERDVLFVASAGATVSPLVGFWHGRFRIARDPATGEDTIRTHDGGTVHVGLGAAKTAAAAVARSSPAAASTRRPLTLREFESVVRDRLELRKGR